MLYPGLCCLPASDFYIGVIQSAETAANEHEDSLWRLVKLRITSFQHGEIHWGGRPAPYIIKTLFYGNIKHQILQSSSPSLWLNFYIRNHQWNLIWTASKRLFLTLKWRWKSIYSRLVQPMHMCSPKHAAVGTQWLYQLLIGYFI